MRRLQISAINEQDISELVQLAEKTEGMTFQTDRRIWDVAVLVSQKD